MNTNQLKQEYVNYLKTDGDIVMELFIGGLAIIFYTYQGLTGFFLGFVILHILGFIIDIYNLDQLDKKARMYRAEKIAE